MLMMRKNMMLLKTPPPFTNPKSVDEDDLDVGYMRVDHTEGIHLIK